MKHKSIRAMQFSWAWWMLEVFMIVVFNEGSCVSTTASQHYCFLLCVDYAWRVMTISVCSYERGLLQVKLLAKWCLVYLCVGVGKNHITIHNITRRIIISSQLLVAATVQSVNVLAVPMTFTIHSQKHNVTSLIFILILQHRNSRPVYV